MSGGRGLAGWSLTVAALALTALLARSHAPGVTAAAVASLAAVAGVLATRGVARRAICISVTLLSVVLLASGAPVLIVTGGLLALVGLIGALGSGSWPASGRRYEAPRPQAKPEPGDLWSRIDRGDDPTA